MKKIWIAGAGSGIGETLLQEFANDKSVFCVGVSRRGRKLNSNLEHGVNYNLDLRSEIELIRFLENYFQTQDLDGVYITLGDGLFKSVETISLEEWSSHLYLNLTVPFLILKHIRKFIKPKGFVCLLGSTASKQGFANSSAYCSSKHGILGLARAIREEWKPYQIRIFCVTVGAVYTPIWENRPEFKKEDMLSKEDFAKFLASFVHLPESINLEEVYTLPLKGIL